MLDHDLPHFKLSEFKHPELVDPRAAYWLNELREEYGNPITLTDDARIPGPNQPRGAGRTSFHLIGTAFDLRSRTMDWAKYWEFNVAVVKLSARLPDGIGIELEFATDPKHIHIGFAFDGRKHRLIVK